MWILIDIDVVDVDDVDVVGINIGVEKGVAL